MADHDMSEISVSIDVSAVPEKPAGAGRYTIELVRALTADAVPALHLVTRKGDTTRWREMNAAATLYDVVPSPRPLRLVYEQLLLGRKLAKTGIDVHHGPHYTMPRHCPIPSVVTIHDVTFFERPDVHEKSKVAFFKRAIRYSAAHASVLVCVSERTAEGLGRHVNVDVPVLVAPHGIDHLRFQPHEQSPGSDEAILTSLGLVPAMQRIVHVGTLEPRKGLLTLLKAFEGMSSDHPELELVLVGQRGWGMDDFDTALSGSPVGTRVKELGYVSSESLPALMRTASLLAYPSIDEGFGLPALEGLACGAPVVTTSDSVMADMCGEAAWLAGPGDPESLAQTLLQALNAGSSEREKRAQMGMARAREFTWEKAAQCHRDAYELALSRGVTKRAK